MNFYINQTFNGTYSPEAAIWCNNNNAFIEKTADGYIIKAVPAPTSEELEQSIRAERDRRIEATRWQIERHRDELAMGIATTLTEEQYTSLLLDVQYLRDLPAQDGFPWDGIKEAVPWQRPKDWAPSKVLIKS